MIIDFLLKRVLLFGVFAFQGLLIAQDIPKPNAAQLAWQKAELGVIFHYDLHVFDGKQYQQGQNRIQPVSDMHQFNPSRLDVEQWVLSAKAAGAKFAMITATHETGFALYPSKVNPYNTKALGWKDGKEDLVGDFISACRKHGIEPAVYMGIRWNSFLGIHDFKAIGEGKQQQLRQQYYKEMAEGMVKEICTWYGPLFKIWFDGGAGNPENNAPDVLPIVKKYQPNALFYHNDQLAEARWAGSESGTVNYPCWSTFPLHFTGSGESAPEIISKNNFKLLKTGDPAGRYFMPAMADAPLRGAAGRHEWFWEPNDEHALYPLTDLMDMYYKSVGRNATLILGVTPDTSGLVPAGDYLRLAEFGEQVERLFGKPLFDKNKAIDKIDFLQTKQVTQLLLAEDISQGQLLRAFHVQAKTSAGWKDIFVGSSMGNKCIVKLDKPIICTGLRLIIDKSISTPTINTFLAYDTTF